MKITVKQLRKIIREVIYRAYRTGGGQRTGNSVRVDAENTQEAGELAAKKFGGNIDPFTIDVEEEIEHKLPQNAHFRVVDLTLSPAYDSWIKGRFDILRASAGGTRAAITQFMNDPIRTQATYKTEDGTLFTFNELYTDVVDIHTPAGWELDVPAYDAPRYGVDIPMMPGSPHIDLESLLHLTSS